MEIGTVRLINIDNEMRTSYLDYSMSVIVQRALPDVRDGMKPVQRRVLYGMHEMGLRRSGRHRKSAGIVGEVLKNFHPHSDTAVYDALVRMAQPWSLRYPLVDGQGNFGSVDGDAPAAMRYCVTGETLVVTERGLERADALSADGGEEIATRVLSAHGRINGASKWFDCGPFPTRRVATRRGYEVTGTTNHPLLVCVQGPDGAPQLVWKTIGEIAPGDYLALDRSETLWPQGLVDLRPLHPELAPASRAARHTLPAALDEDVAFLLGALTAEGTVRPQVIEFTNTPGDFADAFRATWARAFPTCRLHEFLREPVGYGKRPFWQMQIVGQRVVTFLNRLGLVGKSADRTIPEAVLRSPQPIAAAYLRGLFEGDGAVERSGRSLLRVSLCAKSRAFLRQVQTLLLRFGIACALSAEPGRGTYRLLIVGRDELQRFADRIGFASETKRAALTDALSRHTGKALSRTDVVPFVADYVREYAGRGHREWAAKHNLDRPARLAAALPRLADALPAPALATVAWLNEANYLYELVTAVEDAGARPVYSIRVDSPCHSFVANGFVNHNTEARMAEITEELLRDIEKDTVDFRPNYDDSMREPSVLPARLPALLLNGAAGIAVGMATNIPPHNLGELCDAIALLIDQPEATLEQLLELVPGPDFPTGGSILGREGIRQAYATGKGRVIMRAKAFIEEAPRGNRYQIIVTELPYQVNKATLVERIAQLVKDGVVDGISDLRDESDRTGMRIVIELKREAQPRKVLNNLFKHTAMQSTFGVNMLALVDGKQPRVLTLKRAIQHFIEHRQEVVRRRTTFELEKAKQRAHILEGLRIALDHIDDIIATIRNSRTTESARGNLMKNYTLTEAQANAILDIRLARLAQLERKKIEDEYKEVRKLIRELEALLADEAKVLGVIKDDLRQLKEKYNDPRRTVIRDGDGEITDEDLIPELPVLLTLTSKGYVKRLPPDTYRTQHRGGRGVAGMTMREEDDVQHILSCNTMDSLLFFTNQGRCYSLKGHEIPDASRTAKGTAIINLLALQPGEVVTMPMAVKDFSDARYLVLATRKGKIKRTQLSQFAQVRANGLIALGLEEGDELAWVRMSKGDQDVIIVTAQGKSIRFSEEDARPMGRPAAGVTAIRLAEGDVVVGMDVVEPGYDLVFVSANGFGKKTGIDEYPRQGRGGGGVIAMRVTDKTGPLVGARMVKGEDNLMMITSKGIVIRIQGEQISRIGRATQGVTLMKVGARDRVIAMTLVDSTANGHDAQADMELLSTAQN